MRDPLRKRRMSLLSFLLRSRRKKYPRDITWHNSSDTCSETDLPSSRFCETIAACQRQHTMDSSQTALNRATTYLKVLSFKIAESDAGETLHEPKQMSVSLEEVRIEDIADMFHSELNKCNAEALPELRKQRSEIAPIICYESDSEDSQHGATNLQKGSSPNRPSPRVPDQMIDCCGGGTVPPNSNDSVCQARMEALLMQQELLGWDHPDVQFLACHIRQHRRRQSSATTSSESTGP